VPHTPAQPSTPVLSVVDSVVLSVVDSVVLSVDSLVLSVVDSVVLSVVDSVVLSVDSLVLSVVDSVELPLALSSLPISSVPLPVLDSLPPSPLLVPAFASSPQPASPINSNAKPIRLNSLTVFIVDESR
jgi:hypothetical protein